MKKRKYSCQLFIAALASAALKSKHSRIDAFLCQLFIAALASAAFRVWGGCE